MYLRSLSALRVRSQGVQVVFKWYSSDVQVWFKLCLVQVVLILMRMHVWCSHLQLPVRYCNSQGASS